MGEFKDNQNRLEQAVAKRRQDMTDYHIYTEDEMFTMNGEPVLSVLDYWRQECCALVSLQDSIAEFLVSRALGITKAENIVKWTGYDVSYKNKRIEVKATSYIHAWNKGKFSENRTFSIAPSHTGWWAVKDESERKKLSRQSEMYIFCVNTQKDYENYDPLLVDSWDFYVVPTFRINERCERTGNPNQKTIRLNRVQKLAGESVKWTGLKKKVEEAIGEVDWWVEEKDRVNGEV